MFFGVNVRKVLAITQVVLMTASPTLANTLEQPGASASPAAQGGDPCANDGSANNPNPQKAQYCKAAKVAEKGAKNSSTSMKVWAGVAAICTVGCAIGGVCAANIIAGCGNIVHYYAYACGGLNAVAGATDAILNKQMETMMTSLLAAGGPMLAAGLAGGAENVYVVKNDVKENGRTIAKAGDRVDTTSAKGEKLAEKYKGDLEGTPDAEGNPETTADTNMADVAAICGAAALAGLNTYMKKKAEKDQKKTAEENRRLAAALDGANAAVNGEKFSQPQLMGNLSAESGSNRVAASQSAAREDSGTAPIAAQDCSSEGQAGNRVECALANDSELPPIVKDQKFKDKFKDMAQGDLDNFLGQNYGSGADAISTAMSPAIPSEAMGAITAALKKNEEDLIGYNPDVYAGGGGGFSGGGGNKEQDMNALVNGIMDRFLPKGKDGKKDPSAVAQIVFGEMLKGRNPASLSEDPKVSLFARVSYRYFSVSDRISLPELPASPAAGGQPANRPKL